MMNAKEKFLAELVEQAIADVKYFLAANYDAAKAEYAKETLLNYFQRVQKNGSYLQNPDLIYKRLAALAQIKDAGHNPLLLTTGKLSDYLMRIDKPQQNP